MLLPQELLPFYITFIIYSLLLLAGIPLLLLRRHHEPIKSRGTPLLLLQTISGFIAYLVPAIGPIRTGCFLYQFRSVFFALWSFPYVFRGLLLWFRYIRQHALLSIQLSRQKLSSRSSAQVSEEREEGEKEKERPGQRGKEEREGEVSLKRLSEIQAAPSSLSDASFSSSLKKSKEGAEPRKMKVWEIKLAMGLQRNQWVFTWKYEVLVFGGLLLIYGFPAIVRYFAEPFVYPEEMREDPSLTLPDRCDLIRTVLGIGVNAGIFILCIIVVSVLLWSVQDAFHVKHELLGVLVGGVAILPFWAAANFDRQIANLDRYFWAVVGTLYCLLLTVYLPTVLSFAFERRLKRYAGIEGDHAKNVGGPEIIYQVFNHQVLRDNFEEFETNFFLHYAPLILILIFSLPPKKPMVDSPRCHGAMKIFCSLRVLAVSNASPIRKSLRRPKESGPFSLRWVSLSSFPSWPVSLVYFLAHALLHSGGPNEINLDETKREEVMELMNEKRYSRDMFDNVEKDILKLLRFSHISPLFLFLFLFLFLSLFLCENFWPFFFFLDIRYTPSGRKAPT